MEPQRRLFFQSEFADMIAFGFLVFVPFTYTYGTFFCWLYSHIHIGWMP